MVALPFHIPQYKHTATGIVVNANQFSHCPLRGCPLLPCSKHKDSSYNTHRWWDLSIMLASWTIRRMRLTHTVSSLQNLFKTHHTTPHHTTTPPGNGYYTQYFCAANSVLASCLEANGSRLPESSSTSSGQEHGLKRDRTPSSCRTRKRRSSSHTILKAIDTTSSCHTRNNDVSSKRLLPSIYQCN
jgi:hypothetical protein